MRRNGINVKSRSKFILSVVISDKVGGLESWLINFLIYYKGNSVIKKGDKASLFCLP